MTDPLWIFLHLPKTGGTTFNTHLEKHLLWDEELIQFSYWGRHYRATHGRPEFADRTPEQRARARVLSGHQLDYGVHRLFPGREARYFTFVRDPVDRCVSMYNFRRSRGDTDLDFPIWYETYFRTQMREGIVRFYAERLFATALGDRPEEHLAFAKQLLERCWLVSTTDRLDTDLTLLCNAIGIPAGWVVARRAGAESELVSPTHPARGERVTRFFTPDTATRERIYADNPCDLALYRWVVERTSRGAWHS